MASIKSTPPNATPIFVVIAPTMYGIAPSVVVAYTDRNVAFEYARNGGFAVHETLVYHHHDGMTASSDDNADEEPETEPEVKKTKSAKKNKAAKEEGAAKKVSKRTAVPDGQAQSLVDQKYMLAGTLHQMDHKAFTRTVKAYGGTQTAKLTEADYLVVGANPGKKLDEAAGLGVTTINEESFFEAIGADYPEPPAKRAKK